MSAAVWEIKEVLEGIRVVLENWEAQLAVNSMGLNR